MALSSTLITVGAIRLLVVRSVVRAFSTCWPRIRSTTSRAFCGETRIYLASALICSMTKPLCRLRRFFRRGLYRVPLEHPRRRELAEFVSHHVLGHVHRNKLLPVVYRDG